MTYDKRNRVALWPNRNLLFAVDKKYEHAEDKICHQNSLVVEGLRGAGSPAEPAQFL